MALNLDNVGFAEGRCSHDPTVFDNKDGSKKVRITLALADNYKGRDGQRGTQYIPMEAFISADRFASNGLGVYDNIKSGDKVKVEYSLRNNNYTDKDTGKPVYGIVAVIDSIKMQEPKTVTDARHAAKAAEAVVEEAAE